MVRTVIILILTGVGIAALCTSSVFAHSASMLARLVWLYIVTGSRG